MLEFEYYFSLAIFFLVLQYNLLYLRVLHKVCGNMELKVGGGAGAVAYWVKLLSVV